MTTNRQIDLFSEFMSLGYSPGENIYKDRIKDIFLDTLIIARLDSTGCHVIYLSSGSHIDIPWKWIDLFSSYNTLYGGRGLSIENNDEKIDKLIFLFLKLLSYLDTKNGLGFLNTLYQICELKTEELREYILSEFGEKLSPITVDSSDSHLII